MSQIIESISCRPVPSFEPSVTHSQYWSAQYEDFKVDGRSSERANCGLEIAIDCKKLIRIVIRLRNPLPKRTLVLLPGTLLVLAFTSGDDACITKLKEGAPVSRYLALFSDTDWMTEQVEGHETRQVGTNRDKNLLPGASDVLGVQGRAGYFREDALIRLSFVGEGCLKMGDSFSSGSLQASASWATSSARTEKSHSLGKTGKKRL